MGTAIQIPSGMLWRAIANANFVPIITLFWVLAKVMMPSGMLWNIIAKNDITPTLYKLSLLFDRCLFKNVDKIIPTHKKIKINNVSIMWLLKLIFLKLFGKRSKIEIPIIIPEAKLKQRTTTLFWWYLSTYIKKYPIRPAKEAKKDKIKAFKVLVLIINHPTNYML